MEWRREEFWLTDERERLDMGDGCAAIQGSYWGTRRPRALIEESFRNSLCFGLFDGERQIGFCRVVTDKVVFAWFCDVWIDPASRGHGLGSWMMACVMEHPHVVRTRQVLITRDA